MCSGSIDDFATAYRKLDFSDVEDPMRIVNIQLREQAEAAIKDKVATMSIDEVLSDKQPIIEELTHALAGASPRDARGEATSGLGLKIVTVQIKEAVVSSTRVWENIQKPFRADRQMTARMAELQAERAIASRELEIRKANETAQIQTETELAQLRASQEREHYDRQQSEQTRRNQLEAEAERRRIGEQTSTARVRKEGELELALAEIEMEGRRLQQELERVRHQGELDRAKAERALADASAEVEVAEVRHRGKSAAEERDTIRLQERRAVENDLSEGYLRLRLIERLPEIAQALPGPKEMRTVTFAADPAAGAQTAPLAALLAGVLSLVEGLKRTPEAASES